MSVLLFGGLKGLQQGVYKNEDNVFGLCIESEKNPTKRDRQILGSLLVRDLDIFKKSEEPQEILLEN